VGGAAFDVRISVRRSTSSWSRTLAPPVFWRRATSSARRMSILPCRRRRWYEISSSCCVRSSISFLRSSSVSVPRSGSGSTGCLSWSEGGLIEAARPGKGQAVLESLDRARGGPLRTLGLHDLLDELPVLRFESLRVLRRLSLRVEVQQRLVRVGEHLRPAPLVEDLDAVREVEPAGLSAFGGGAPCGGPGPQRAGRLAEAR